jgi:hypothetical protein
VLIKPDNFRFATGRPGNVIDFFSRTGLFIVGAKGPPHEHRAGDGILRPGPRIPPQQAQGRRQRQGQGLLEKEFNFKISADDQKASGISWGRSKAIRNSTTLSGSCPAMRPAKFRRAIGSKPGTEKCIASSMRASTPFQNPRCAGPHGPVEGASRQHPPRIRLDDHGQCGARQRFPGKRPARIRHRQTRGKQLQADHRGSLRKTLTIFTALSGIVRLAFILQALKVHFGRFGWLLLGSVLGQHLAQRVYGIRLCSGKHYTNSRLDRCLPVENVNENIQPTLVREGLRRQSDRS